MDRAEATGIGHSIAPEPYDCLTERPLSFRALFLSERPAGASAEIALMREIHTLLEVLAREKTHCKTHCAEGQPTPSAESDPLSPHTDNNGLRDFDEFQNTSDPNLADTDGDKILDRDEEVRGHWQIEGKDPGIAGNIVGARSTATS